MAEDEKTSVIFVFFVSLVAAFHMTVDMVHRHQNKFAVIFLPCKIMLTFIVPDIRHILLIHRRLKFANRENMSNRRLKQNKTNK